MLRPLTLAAICLSSTGAQAQELPFVDFQDFVDSLTAVATIPDPVERNERVSTLWAALRAEVRIPFTEGDSAAVLWRGTATSVAVPGDHSGWNPSGQGLARVGLSDVWMRTYRFPVAARIDYKLVLNGSTWILDPNNPHQQYSGFGPNSELRMPSWVFPTETVRDPNVPQGTLSPDIQIASDTLGYPVRYRVYTPAAYSSLSDLPVIYVTDGHEYSDDRLGAMRIVVDNLVHAGRATPPIVVFIDPRSVANGQNQRADQYVQNPAFAHFVARELVPAVDAEYRTHQDRDGRVILGTSLGGVFALYLGLQQPDVFGRLAMQSPAFWVTEHPDWWTGPSLFEMAAAGPAAQFGIFLTTGTINDGAADARRMRDILLGRSHLVTFREVPEGHSWGNWRALLDDMLEALVPGPASPAEAPPTPSGGLNLVAAPNPSAGSVDLRFVLPAAGAAEISCFDVQGRRVMSVVSDTLHAGSHSREISFDRAGRYACRLSAGADSAVVRVTVVR